MHNSARFILWAVVCTRHPMKGLYHTTVKLIKKIPWDIGLHFIAVYGLIRLQTVIPRQEHRATQSLCAAQIRVRLVYAGSSIILPLPTRHSTCRLIHHPPSAYPGIQSASAYLRKPVVIMEPLSLITPALTGRSKRDFEADVILKRPVNNALTH